MLEVKRLRLLNELASRGTLVAVAEALNYSPSAVSQQLAILEREVGVPLFRRSGRNLELTSTAKFLAAEVEHLLNHIERIESAMRASQGEIRGAVRVAAFQTAMLAILPQALGRLRADYPDLRVDVVQHEPEAALYETSVRGFDLVIAEQYPGHAAGHFDGLDRRPLTQDPIQLALPEIAGDAEFDGVTSLAAAGGLPWVMEPKPAASRHWAEQLCRSAGFEPDIRFETADLQAHVRLVESGNAVALLPGLVHVGRRPRLRLLDLPGRPRRTVFTAARAASDANPAISVLRTVLAEEAGALGAAVRP
ncbi:MAG: LysR family transcriptional regulator [Gordonia sp. (in: high G+C Gram-positive bacteria)]